MLGDLLTDMLGVFTDVPTGCWLLRAVMACVTAATTTVFAAARVLQRAAGFVLLCCCPCLAATSVFNGRLPGAGLAQGCGSKTAADHRVRVVVFIDDLDRCKPDKIIEVGS